MPASEDAARVPRAAASVKDRSRALRAVPSAQGQLDASRPAYEHPWAVRFTHWISVVTITVLTLSGLQIFTAFPSFGPKVPQQNLIEDIPEALRLGGWLGGALQWHFTFMWIFAGAGVLYMGSQLLSGHFRTVLFMPRDVSGLWPMARYYLRLGDKPPAIGQYNPLQKAAYTTVMACGALSLLSGAVMFMPVQLSPLAALFGGFANARIVHFVAMCGLLLFIPGHLLMVAIHGWDNFRSMLIGWKQRPEHSVPLDKIAAESPLRGS